LWQIRAAGFRHVEIPSAWLRVGDLAPSRLEEFARVLRDLELGVPGLSVVRESVIHPANGPRNIAFSHRTIDAAAALGVPIVCLGLHDALLPAQRDAQWFWTAPGPRKPTDRDTYETAVAAYRELGTHAQEVGVDVSLELYEDTYLGSGRDAVTLIEDIGSPSVGINPDLGNLVRKQGPVEHWHDILTAVLPYTNYWHAKNVIRFENALTGDAFSAPATMQAGIIDYRRAVAEAVAAGYAGAFVVEHYGGDGLGVGAANRDYLADLLAIALQAKELAR
jgi:sugar phosphate isomerase/epimerase